MPLSRSIPHPRSSAFRRASSPLFFSAFLRVPSATSAFSPSLRSLRPLRSILLLLLLPLSACTSRGTPGPVQIAPGQYETAFNAARESLREANFQLDRIDAAAGVITTYPKTTGGLATPWDMEQSSAAQEWEDMLNQQARRVRITFAPAGAATAQPASATPSTPAADQPFDEITDLRTYAGPLSAEIDVVVDRTTRPNWRVQPRSVLSSRFARDPIANERGIGYPYDVALTRDTRYSDRLADDIRSRMTAPAPAKD